MAIPTPEEASLIEKEKVHMAAADKDLAKNQAAQEKAIKGEKPAATQPKGA